MSCQTSTWFGLWTTLETTLWTEWVSDNARQCNDQTWVRYLEQVNLKHQLRIKRSRWKRLRACALKRKQEMKQNPSSSLFLSHPGWAEQWIEPHHKHHHQNIQYFGWYWTRKGADTGREMSRGICDFLSPRFPQITYFTFPLTLMASEIEIDIWYVPVHFLFINWLIRVIIRISVSTNSRKLHFSNRDDHACIHTIVEICLGCLSVFNFYLWISSTSALGF